MKDRYHQIADLYPHLKFPEKYTGERPVTMRSGWEIKFALKYLDINENIVEWKSELPIQYICGTDGRSHRYFIDFWFKAKTKDGKFKEFLVEVKPSKECTAPVPPKRMTASYHKQVGVYVKNQSKWKAAENLCEGHRIQGRDIEFMTLTEKDCPWFLK